MNGNLNNERLSALLDGELTVEERAELEAQIAQSPELQRELAELRRVSAAIRELPQVPAPSDLHASVMAAIRQEVQPAADNAADARRAGGGIGLMRLAGLAAAVAIAAGAAIWFGQDRGNQIAENNGGPEIISVQQERPAALANRAEVRDATGGVAETVGGSPDELQSTVSVETRQRVLQISRDDLTAARVGDIIEAVDTNDDSVGVIRLTVVDRTQGVEALQVLLSGQQFETVDGREASAASTGLVAVYVESDREKLSQAISEFREQLKFGSLEVAAPVRIAELEPESRSELGIDDAHDSATASQRTVALKPGSQLDRLVQPTAPTAEDAASATEQPAAAGTPKADKPMRVIFVVVDAPKPAAENKPAAKENGAA